MSNKNKEGPLADWQTTCWQGICVQTPDDWAVSHVNGDYKDGYIRWADEDGTLRLEIRWSEAPASDDIEQVMMDYLSDVTKAAKRTNRQILTRTDTKLLTSRQVSRRKVMCFTIETDWVGHGLVWKCPRCERRVIAQVMGNDPDDTRELALNVLQTLSDHSEEIHNEWSIYGLNVKVPNDFALETSQLEYNVTELHFKRDESTSITVARWTLADIRLRNTTLNAWTAHTLKDKLKQFKIYQRPSEIRTHTGLHLNGQRKAPGKLVRSFFRQLTKVDAPPDFFGWVWPCEQSNRILMVTAFLPATELQTAHTVAESVACH